MEFLTEVRWSPYIVGIGIGVLSWLTFLISRQPLACSTTFARTSGLLERLMRGTRVENMRYYQEIKLTWGWQGMLVVGIVCGALLSALLSGDFQGQWVPDRWAATFGDSVLPRLLVALLGGIFMGFGARWANGCTSGHGISGSMQLAVSSWISALCFFIGGILTAKFIFNVIGGG
ncbi:YeeE/YedE thiosulfate transporter family protein [Desulfonatronum thioautotrophicum]|uniref:YeeE/YedE thiosulfate transporter family protein n=1 Tax=Desulfonatronum thioautotrophicum TaxID=617001 RepID=UPI0005EBA2DB|nr:YeeE/YedE thiosulfate transporter family protein [Desulfonatronum thioautotrophicum]